MIVFQIGNQFWIEVFDIARVSLAAGSSTVTPVTPERSGTFLGLSATMDADAALGDLEDCTLTCRNTDDSLITIGQAITTIEALKTNGSANAVIFGGHIVIFMRGTGK